MPWRPRVPHRGRVPEGASNDDDPSGNSGRAGARANPDYFTGVDHRDHEALGALDHVRGGGVGIARYVRDREDPYAAEIAVTVIDGWQGRGLGTELLAQLSERACQEGIRRFTAAVAADNAAMTGLLRNFGGEQVRRSSARTSTRSICGAG